MIFLQNEMISEIDEALLSYEKTVAVASEEGVDVATKNVRYEWTYVQSVFFSSTIITTVGKTIDNQKKVEKESKILTLML